MRTMLFFLQRIRDAVDRAIDHCRTRLGDPPSDLDWMLDDEPTKPYPATVNASLNGSKR